MQSRVRFFRIPQWLAPMRKAARKVNLIMLSEAIRDTPAREADVCLALVMQGRLRVREKETAVRKGCLSEVILGPLTFLSNNNIMLRQDMHSETRLPGSPTQL